MIQSMTGYGKSIVAFNGKKIHAEVKSLNSKAFDLTTRIASIYREKEMDVRQILQQKLERGKVDFVLWVEKDETSAACLFNLPLVKAYKQQIELMQQELGLPAPDDWYATLLRLPDVFAHTDMEELSDEEWLQARCAVEEAADELVAFRQQEGKALAAKFQEKIDNIAALLASIEPYEKERTEKIRQRFGRKAAPRQPPALLRRNHARGARAGKETRIHRPGNGARNQHYRLEVEPG